MEFYLSSYKLGNEKNKLLKMTQNLNKKIAYVPNALDFSKDLERKQKSEKEDISELKKLGFKVNLFDLKNYFKKHEKLKKDISKYDIIFVRGGNVFVLRQAMEKSGLDKHIINMWKNKKPILYSGYSAGICVLAPNLKGLELVDDLNQKPYGNNQKIIWKGLGIIKYLIIPHYKSNHPESKAIDKVVRYCKEKKILFKTLKDGEVIIIK